MKFQISYFYQHFDKDISVVDNCEFVDLLVQNMNLHKIVPFLPMYEIHF